MVGLESAIVQLQHGSFVFISGALEKTGYRLGCDLHKTESDGSCLERSTTFGVLSCQLGHTLTLRCPV